MWRCPGERCGHRCPGVTMKIMVGMIAGSLVNNPIYNPP
jgi:hypothetical protein